MMTLKLQEWIHRFEEGAGARYLRRGLAIFALVFLVVVYNVRAYRNMSAQEAMDTAQLARNIAEGKGYTTLFVRPFSMFLISQNNKGAPDAARLRQMHPDIANPPVYPLVLAGLMKVLPFNYNTATAGGFWKQGRPFWWHQPDFLIGLFNQLLFFACVVIVFFLARRLFDAWVAWISAGVFLGTEIFWRFSVSGLSTMLLVLIFLALVSVIVRLERGCRDEAIQPSRLIALALLAGLLTGLGALTRYSFGLLIVPVIVFLILFGGRARTPGWLAAAAMFLLVLSPWIVRNYSVSGAPFGTAGYAPATETIEFSGTRLERSLEPDLRRLGFRNYWHKLLQNSREIIRDEIPRMGGSWVTALFLVGLLVGFRNPTLSRLRYFMLMCLAMLIAAQALGKTHLTYDSAEINSENLLVLLMPLVIIYGVSLFMILLDQIQLPFPQLRYIIIGVFGIVACLPMIFAVLPPRGSPVAYPPYAPHVIHPTAHWMNPDDLMMSDIPWAVAWYGQRQCVWMTLDGRKDFFAINDYQKPVKALYLTPRTMDSKFLSEWVRAGEHSWGSFVVQFLLRGQPPADFPLRHHPVGFLPEQLFLADWPRWTKPE